MCFQRCPSVAVWEAFLPHLRRGKGRVLHVGTSVAHDPQKGTATQLSGIEALWRGECDIRRMLCCGTNLLVVSTHPPSKRREYGRW